jgi:hypothetical protein
MRRTLSILLRRNNNRYFSSSNKDFYDRFKNLKKQEELKNKNRRVSSTIDYLADEIDFKKELEENFRTEITSHMLNTIEADPIKQNQQKREELLNYVEDQKKNMITTDKVFSSGNKVMDLDKANRILDSRIHRVSFIFPNLLKEKFSKSSRAGTR